MDYDDVIATLNDLIETCRDGEKRFRACAEDVTRSDLEALFNKAARRYAEAGLELKVQLRSLGGRTEKAGSSAGSAITSAETGKDDAAMLAECERGEDVARKSYENALKKVLPPVIRSIVRRQYERLLHDDHVRDLGTATTVQLAAASR